MPSLPPELWTQVLTGVITLIVGLSSGTAVVAWMNRRKTAAEALHEGADAAKVITDAAREAVELHTQVWEQRLNQAKTDCLDLVRRAVADSEQRCRKEMAEQEERHRLAMAEQEERYARELERLREWGSQLEAKSCQRIDHLERALADERELRQHRDDELREIAESLP